MPVLVVSGSVHAFYCDLKRVVFNLGHIDPALVILVLPADLACFPGLCSAAATTEERERARDGWTARVSNLPPRCAPARRKTRERFARRLQVLERQASGKTWPPQLFSW